jgi:hypothetical protein
MNEYVKKRMNFSICAKSPLNFNLTTNSSQVDVTAVFYLGD